jgi:GAF domain-containing protein
MPYVTCSACGIKTYLVSQGECAECGAVLGGPARRQGPMTGGDPDRGIHRTLELARLELGADTAFISEVAAGRETIRWAVGNGAIPGFAPGASLPLEDTICRHLLAGRIAALVPDLEQDPVLRELPLPRVAGIRAYLGVALTGADARQYVLCCLAREARPDLGDADVRFLQGLTESLALSGPLCG